MGALFCRDLALPCDRLLSFIYLKHNIGKSPVLMETSTKASESETGRMRKVGAGTAPCSKGYPIQGDLALPDCLRLSVGPCKSPRRGTVFVTLRLRVQRKLQA